jgi:hypothetical protein
MSKNTGGPAFPANEMNGDGSLYMQHFGMTLRDYFAAKALDSILAPNPATGQYALVSDFPACAETAYKMADAMMKARES